MKIKLRFIIKAYKNDKYKKNKLNKLYDGTLTLDDILKDIYERYSQNKLSQEELKLLGPQAYIYGGNLFEKNYIFKGLELETESYEYHNISISDLETQFNITKKQFEIWLDSCIGDCVAICRGIHLFFHTNERDIHHQPHIHCKYGSEEFRVDLINIRILDKPFKSKSKTKKAMGIIKINQQELIKYWNNVVVKGEKVKLKLFLPVR